MNRDEFQFRLPQLGFFRDHKKLFSDYRTRASFIGPLQVGMAMVYLCIWCLTRNDNILQQYKTINYLVSNGASICMKSEDTDMNAAIWKYLYETWKVTYNFDLGDCSVGFVVFRRTIWMDLYAISSIFHMWLSALLTCSAREGLTKARALQFCYFTKIFNLFILITELITYTVLFQKWKISLGFLFYRMLFNREITGLLKMIENLAPPPPGH